MFRTEDKLGISTPTTSTPWFVTSASVALEEERALFRTNVKRDGWLMAEEFQSWRLGSSEVQHDKIWGHVRDLHAARVCEAKRRFEIAYATDVRWFYVTLMNDDTCYPD